MRHFIIRGIALTSIAMVIAIALAIPQCPPALVKCSNPTGYVGGAIWVCCKEVEDPQSHLITCYDYLKTQQTCGTVPETYGWEITSDTLDNGNCVGGQEGCL